MKTNLQTVLIVDDDKNWRDTIRIILRDHYVTTTACDYQEAKEKLITTKPAFHVAVLDMRLDESDYSNIDGLLLLEDIEINKIPTNVVIISGFLSTKAVKIAMSKPFVSEVLEKGSEGLSKQIREAVEKASNNAIAKRGKVRIFISYAKEDLNKALSIFDLLRRNNFEPFLDEKGLVPGSDWDLELDKAIQESHFFLACLSTNSVTKEGYFQKELKRGLEYLERKPEGSIYLIPVKLDECSIPQRFRVLQWCDYFRGDGPEKLIEAIRLGCQKRGLQYWG